MQLLDLLRTIASNLNRMRVRVILTAFGVVIGTAAVLVLVSLGAGLQRSATQEIGGIAFHPRWVCQWHPVRKDAATISRRG